MVRSPRRQRELAQRADLILDAAHALITEQGFAALGMDQLAEATDYSKGTVYQHFSCKEEVLIHLAMRGVALWRGLFQRALTFPGLPRERLLALHYAHYFFAKLHPLEYQANYAVKSLGIAERISADSHAAHEALLGANVEMVVGVIEDALGRGDLALPPDMRPADLVTALWGSHYGNLMLQSYGFVYPRLGIDTVERGARLVFRALLDGLGWRPLSSEHDYDATTGRLLSGLFAEENARLREAGPVG